MDLKASSIQLTIKMPYIKDEQRKQLDSEIEILAARIATQGEESRDGCMNYTVTKLIRALYPLRYIHQNAVIGMLECVKQEHYRRVIADYEDLKAEENGDIE